MSLVASPRRSEDSQEEKEYLLPNTQRPAQRANFRVLDCFSKLASRTPSVRLPTHRRPHSESYLPHQTRCNWSSSTWATLLVTIAVIAAIGIATSYARSPGCGASCKSEAECPRVIVHKFDNGNGFGSELSIYLRAASIAESLGAPVVFNSSQWLYGDLRSMFDIEDPTDEFNCRLPRYLESLAPTADLSVKETDGDVTTPKAVHFGQGHWTEAPRVDLSRTKNVPELHVLDKALVKADIDLDQVAALKLKEHWYAIDWTRKSLPYGQSVHAELLKSFQHHVRVMAGIWHPRKHVQAQIDRLAHRVGLDVGKPGEEGRRPVIALQIRLGDKIYEQSDIIESGTHLKWNDLSPYYLAARLALSRLYDAGITPAPYTFPVPECCKAKSKDNYEYPPILRHLKCDTNKVPKKRPPKPLLLIMSAEENIVDRIRDLDSRSVGNCAGQDGGVFEVIHSPSAELTAAQEKEYIQRFGKMDGPVFRPPGDDGDAPDPPSQRSAHAANSTDHARRWLQYDFQKASLDLRLALSRQLIAELTVYSRMADAFVVSGNSNLGRMALMLGGAEGALGYGVDFAKSGPLQEARKAVGGRIRSVDVPWFPTAYRSNMYHS